MNEKKETLEKPEKESAKEPVIEPKETEGTQEQAPPEKPKPLHPDLKWYVVHTYSGYEDKAKKALEERARSTKLQEYLGQILIPSENVVEMVKGKKRTIARKFFPGYILVQLVLTPPKITGFVGDTSKPVPISEEEVMKLTRQITEGTLKSKPKVTFADGDQIRVIDGPFANFNGVVDDVKPDKGKVRVLVSIFGRSTPVELDFSQVEKVS